MTNLCKHIMHKKAGIYTDAIAGTIADTAAAAPLAIYQAKQLHEGDEAGAKLTGGINAIINSTAQAGAGLHGLLGRADDQTAVEALREMNEDAAKSLIPYVGVHRYARRARLIGRLLGSKSKYLHEAFANINPINALGAPAGALAALITRGRTVDEQAVEEQDAPWKDWLIPGMATYNSFKRLGVANRVGNSEKGDAIDRDIMKYVKKNKK